MPTEGSPPCLGPDNPDPPDSMGLCKLCPLPRAPFSQPPSWPAPPPQPSCAAPSPPDSWNILCASEETESWRQTYRA